MRVRILAFVGIAVLVYLAVKHNSALPVQTDPTAFLLHMRNHVAPYQITLGTSPEPPESDLPVTLEAHVVDAAGKPADGLVVEAYASMSETDHGAQSVTLRGKGNGNYEGKLNLETVGTWNLDLTVSKGNQRVRQRRRIEVSPEKPRGRDADDDDS